MLKTNPFRRRITFEGIKNDIVYCGPQLVHLYINTNCNLRCEYCWFHSHLSDLKIEGRILAYEKFKEILEDCKKLKVEHIVLSSIGEPSLHPDIEKMINDIKNAGMLLRITTNLTFSKKSLLKAFAKVDQLAINFSAVDDESYRAMYKPLDKSNFSRVIKNIYFIAKVRARFKKPSIEMRFIITNNNFKNIPRALELYRDLNVDYVYFTFMDDTKYNKKIELTGKNKLVLKEILAIQAKKKFTFRTNIFDIYESLANYRNCAFKLRRCLIIWERISVEINGKASLCCHNENLTVGDIYKDNLRNLWFAKKTQKIRSLGKYSFNLRNKIWKSCKYCFAAEQNHFYEKMLDLSIKK